MRPANKDQPSPDTQRRIDEPLLHALFALLSEGSVSRAAVRLGIAQSAVSRHLKSLRELTGDELLVRVGNRMILTERAEGLMAPTRRMLSDMSFLKNERGVFEPQHARQTFRLSAYDFLPGAFFADIVARIVKASPDSELVLSGPRGLTDRYRLLGEGELDALITIHDELPPHLRAINLLSDEVVCVMRRDHPLADSPLNLESYKRAQHLGSIEPVGRHGETINAVWADRGIKVHTTVQTQYLALTGEILAATNLIFSTGRVFASALAKQHRLVVVDFPVAVPPLRYRMLWHERTHRNSAQTWFRAQVVAAARSFSNTNNSQG